MKRVVWLVIALVGLWTSIGFANENWEYVGDSNDAKTYIDTTSISYRPTVKYDMYKVKSKVEYSDGLTNVSVLLINSDTKYYSFISTDTYMNNQKTHSWTYDSDNWSEQGFDKESKIIDRTIELGNKLRALN
jgi:hypothetical protein